ncbi:MAG TPA: ABC transporter ATP-binding protein [Solirubrobacteraceae bacterium]|nr:ABC transporter ATP-binding protein [Solirubrobacteraceae bacterium]
MRLPSLAEERRGRAAPAAMGARVKLLIGDRRGAVVGLALSSVFGGFIEAAFLTLVAQIATSVVAKGNRVAGHSLLHFHASTGTLILIAFALTLARLMLQVPLSVLPARIAADVQAGLRRRIFHAFTRASWTVQSADREGQLQETMTSQVMQATGGALQATALITSSLTFIVLLGVAFVLNGLAALVVLVSAVGIFALLRPLRALGVRRARELSEAQVAYARGVAEANRLAEDTRVFGVGGAQRERIDVAVERSRQLFYRTQLLIKLIPNLYQNLIYILLVAMLAAIYLSGTAHAASLAAMVLLLVRAGQSGLQVQSAYQSLSQSTPFIERTQNAERRYEQSASMDGGRPLPQMRTLAFENVSFGYHPDRPVLSGVSFEVEAGEAIGIIGPSGAGKSTLVQIVLQLREPVAGGYLVNGLPVREFARADWNRRVSFVPQEPRLLHASVAENIRFFRELDMESIERAGRLARIHDDVMSWPDGYETIVGPRADAVSGGQQQRICLARALAARPQVLVLDEPTSALDPHSETLIQESLSALKSELTLFIIAHRMSTLDICDRVMVIVDGRMVAFDTRALLREQNHYYRSASLIAAGTPGSALP